MYKLFNIFNITDITKVALGGEIDYSYRTPEMTGNETPYGHAEAFDEYAASYPAWKGMNGTTVNGGDAWVSSMFDNTAISPESEEAWFAWWLRDEDLNAGKHMMVINTITITPRGGMTTGWYTDNNPYRMRIKGIAEDMSEFTIMDEYRTDNWTGGGARTIDLTGMTDIPIRGFKIFILGTRSYDGGGNFHTAIGNLVAEGVASPTLTGAVYHDKILVTYDGELVTYNH